MHGTQGEIARIISIHAPPRGATCIVAGRSCTKPDFNSRPSARGDKACLLACLLASLISIHAPPRGATLLRGGLLRGGLISIHAPPRGATAAAPRLRAEANYFNSRPSARGDRKADADALAADLFQFTPLREGRRGTKMKISIKKISIHAPPRGATRRQVLHFPHLLFQFTPLREGRPALSEKAGISKTFQFTPLREGRPALSEKAGISKTFQFTPLREGRPALSEKAGISKTFQFTPLREGRRMATESRLTPLGYFNSRPSARGDADLVEPAEGESISIHAPPRGATIRGASSLTATMNFNSRPSARGDRRRTSITAFWRNFNSRPSARGD